MKHCSLFSWLGILTTLAVISPKSVLALEPAEISARAKTFTVQIDGAETGSGTIIEQNGNTYTALTCWHVVDTPGNYEITTEDGVKHRVKRVKNLENIDLAVVEFSSENDYPTAQLGESEILVEGSGTFVVGYPDPIPGIPERTYRFAVANIISQLSTPDNGYKLIHSTPLAPGSSGGAILDNDANLVGINGAMTFDGNTNTAYGLAIPLEIYLDREADLTVVNQSNSEVSADESDRKVEVSNNSVSNTAGKPNTEPNSANIAANTSTFDSLVSVGKKQIRQIKYEDAVSTFDRALNNNPNNLDAYYGRGEANFRLGDFNRVVKDFDRVLELNSQDAQAYFYRAYAYAELGRTDRAISDFGEAIELNPDDESAYISRSSVYRDREDYQNALVDLTEAIELDPNSFDAYYDRGLTYHEIGKNEKAIADYTKAINIAPEKKLPVLEARAIAYLTADREPKAIQDLETAANLFFERGEISESRRIFEILGRFAKDYLKEKIEAYSEAIDANPDDLVAYQKRALLYNKLGKSDKAIEDYTQVINLNPQDGKAYNNRAWLYESLENSDLAIADYSKAISLNPENAKTYNNRGSVYSSIQEYANAINDLDRAIKLNPSFVKAYLNRALVYENLERYQRAIRDLQTASELLKQQMKSQEYLEVVEMIQNIEEQ